MIDLYLMAATEAEMLAALVAAGVTDEDGFPVAGVSLDHIGPFSRVTGYDKANKAILVDYPGWHTNLRLVEDIDTSALLAYIIDTPTTPHRVWA
jgi:uncharacterized protein GlcG (DUF336 family)